MTVPPKVVKLCHSQDPKEQLEGEVDVRRALSVEVLQTTCRFLLIADREDVKLMFP